MSHIPDKSYISSFVSRTARSHLLLLSWDHFRLAGVQFYHGNMEEAMQDLNLIQKRVMSGI